MSSRIDELEKEVDRLVVQVLVFLSGIGVEEGCRRVRETGEGRREKEFKFACFFETRIREHDVRNRSILSYHFRK